MDIFFEIRIEMEISLCGVLESCIILHVISFPLFY